MASRQRPSSWSTSGWEWASSGTWEWEWEQEPEWSWWRDPWGWEWWGSPGSCSTGWRDPWEEAAEAIADDSYTTDRARAIDEHGPARVPGAYFGGPRSGCPVANRPARGQQHGRSGAPHEKFPTHEVFRIDVLMSIKEAGYWWTETLAKAAEHDLKMSYRAMRFSKQGPGWYSMTATGPGGGFFLEDALKSLCVWRPDFDINAVALPELADEFALRAIKDASGNVEEHLMTPGRGHNKAGVVLVEASLREPATESDTRIVLRPAPLKRRRKAKKGAPEPMSETMP